MTHGLRPVRGLSPFHLFHLANPSCRSWLRAGVAPFMARFHPGAGKDTVRPGRGNDFVNVADVQFKDNVQCGPGSKDKVWANPEDFVRKDCENVRVF
jgi:hypothetical protein